jgi:hypothetical protein
MKKVEEFSHDFQSNYWSGETSLYHILRRYADKPAWKRCQDGVILLFKWKIKLFLHLPPALCWNLYEATWFGLAEEMVTRLIHSSERQFKQQTLGISHSFWGSGILSSLAIKLSVISKLLREGMLPGSFIWLLGGLSFLLYGSLHWLPKYTYDMATEFPSANDSRHKVKARKHIQVRSHNLFINKYQKYKPISSAVFTHFVGVTKSRPHSRGEWLSFTSWGEKCQRICG